MKKFISILTMLILALFAFYSLSVNTYADTTSDNNLIVMDAKKNSDGIKLVGNNGHIYSEADVIYIKFTGSDKMEGTATIYYSTQDATAVASAKDYESTSGSLTLSKNDYTKTVSIKVGNNTFGVQSAEHNGVSTRYFKFIVTEIVYSEGSFFNAVTEDDSKSVLCDINYDHYYATQSNNNKVFFSEYKNYVKDSEWMYADDGSKSKSKVFFASNQTVYDWNEWYVKTGIADIYGGMEIYHEKNVREFFGADTAYFMYSKKDDCTTIEKINFDISASGEIHYTFKDQVNNTNSKIFISSYSHGVATLSPSDFGDDSSYFYGVKLTDSKNKKNNPSRNYQISCEVDNDDPDVAVCSGVTTQIDAFEKPIDVTAPYVVSLYGLNNNLTRYDGKIRIALRFNEPVRVTSNNIYAKVKFDINNEAYFQYAEGSETDTLVFELAVNDAPNHSYNEVTLLGLYDGIQSDRKSNAIVDYSIKANKVSEDNTIKGTVDYDFSSPQISEIYTSQSGSVTKTRAFSVEINNVSNGALYYMFSKDNTKLTYDASTTSLSQFIKNYYSNSIVVSRDRSIYTIEATDKDGSYLNGGYYLHVFVLSGNGKGITTVDGSNGTGNPTEPYYFDSTDPVVSYSVSGDVKSKKVTLSISDQISEDIYSRGIKEVTVDGFKPNSYGNTEKNVFVAAAEGNISMPNLTFTINTDEIAIENGSYGYFDFVVTITDFANNVTTKKLEKLLFDTRNVFELEEKLDKKEFETTEYQEKVIVGNDRNIKYTIKTDTYKTYKLFIKKLSYGSETYEATYDSDGLVNNSFSTKLASMLEYTSEAGSITLYPKKSGRIDVVFGLLSPSDIVDSKTSAVTIKKDSNISGIDSMHYVYYCTEEFKDEVVNYLSISSPEYVKNYLYTIPNVQYNYLTNAGEKKTTNYTDAGAPIFSTRAKASDYVKYFELQDLYVIHLDSTSDYIINCLNNRDYTSSFAKSRDETKDAKANQYWVRYKESTWTYGQSANQGWVYYYLSDNSGVIDSTNLPTVLKNSIETVTEYIVGKGNYQYFAGPNYVDGSGRPNVKASQIISKTLNDVTVTKSGASFKKPLYLEKDSKIFDSYHYSYDESGNITETTPMLMNYTPDLTTDSTTRFFYTQRGSSNYIEIKEIGAKTLDSFFPSDAQCIYEIIELGTNGAKKYLVYVDKKAPELNVKYVSSGEETSIPISTSGSLSVKSIKFVELVDGDKYSYVHIAKNSGAFESITCLLPELPTATINLTDGSYTLYISDRCGNSFEFYLSVNKSAIEMTEKENIVKGNSCVLLSIENRTLEEIASYLVYLDGDLISSTPTLNGRFTESGNYDFVVTDIYGYTEKREDVLFKRTLPEVSWTYYKDGKYTHYELDTDPPLEITSAGDKGSVNAYIVRTSVVLTCIFNREYTFEFSDGFNEYFSVTENGTTRVVVSSLDNWALTIFYPGDDATKVTYVCMVDNTSPLISVTYDVNTYIVSDYADLDNKASKETENGIIIEGTSATFDVVPEQSRKDIVAYNSTVSSSSFMLSIKDDNLLGSVSVTLDGKPLEVTLESIMAGEVELTGYGKYVITAKDIFGNEATFVFTNSGQSLVERLVDGKLHNETANVITGNTSDVITVNYNAMLFYKITVDGESKLYMFRINNSGLSTMVYKTVMGESKMTWGYVNDETIFDLNSVTSQKNIEVQIGKSPISVVYTDSGYTFKVSASSTVMNIVYSVRADEFTECLQFESKLSQELTDITLLNNTDSTAIITNQNEKLILVHDSFGFSYPISEDIVKVSFGYSTTNIPASDYSLTEIDFSSSNNIATDEDGFYLIKIENVYGNILIYKISKFVDILVETRVDYSTGDYNLYSSKHEGTVYSNHTATVTLFDDNKYTSFSVEKLVDNEYVLQSDVTIHEDTNMYYVVLEGEGQYKVIVIDVYGNTSTKLIEIKKVELEYDDSLITGFNDTALEKYYTKNVLSISKPALEALGYLYVRVDDTVIYNVISENDKINNDTLFVDCIGMPNERKTYVVSFRDKYGNECSREVYYSSNSTLKVERNYMNISTYEEVDCSNNVYSNNSIKLTSGVSNCIFIIDGVETALNVVEFSFANDGNYTTHMIEYKDVYGFDHKFSVNIIRQNININVVGADQEKEINSIYTVKGSFSLSYTADSTCVYTIDNQKPLIYNDEVFTESGVYFFTVTDLAGNNASLRVKLDNICEYEFVESASGQSIYYGKIADSRIRFLALNGDLTSISKVTKDGKEIEFTGDSFTEHGLYHIVIKDEIGNQSEFEFRLITHKVSQLIYEAPTGYSIYEIFVEVNSKYTDNYTNFEPKYFDISNDGSYTVVLKNDSTGVQDTFSFVVDNTKPVVSANVDSNTGSTREDVIVSGFERGDIVEVYKDDKLIKTMEITSEKSITISEAGKYKVIVTNEAGLSTTLSFKREFVMNTAGSVLLILSCVALSTALMIGLMLRKRSRVDK